MHFIRRFSRCKWCWAGGGEAGWSVIYTLPRVLTPPKGSYSSRMLAGTAAAAGLHTHMDLSGPVRNSTSASATPLHL